MALLQTIVSRITAFRNAWPLTPLALTFLTTVFVFCFDNATYWALGRDIFAGHRLSFTGYNLAIFLLVMALFSLFAFPYVVKPFLAFILILSASTSYYMDNLGVIIDRDMIQNVMVTTLTESKHLFTASLISHLVVYGILPAALVMIVKLKPQRPLRRFLLPVAASAVSVALTVGLLMADLKAYSSILRERKDYMSSFQPGAPLVGAVRYVRLLSKTVNTTAQPLGEDATKGAAYASKARPPVLTVVVAGETARAQNFGLNGYARDTTPRLAHLPVVNFDNVSSCGTATATSLPCMFSKFSRADYSHEKGLANQNVLDVFMYAGLHVEWWDNNTGDKNLAKRATLRRFTNARNDRFCASGECMDGIFMQALRDYMSGITEDTVLVIHQIGSHGPTYYLRYPEELERFTPACRTAEFKSCTKEEITNAYDNTIAYTDEVLAQMIEMLQSETRLTTALIYLSDHGESLGEGGLYLHGAPYFMAPKEQTQVPMLLWLSDAYQTMFGLERSCLAQKASETLSHDNFFHSLLGLLDIETGAKDAALDIFASCKSEQALAGN